MKQVIHTDSAPAAIGPYSQAIQIGDLLFVSGQVPIDPSTGAIVEGDVKAQAQQSLNNLKAILNAAGTNMGAVVKTTVFLAAQGRQGGDRGHRPAVKPEKRPISPLHSGYFCSIMFSASGEPPPQI